jgi:hypothetical protein
MGFLRRVLGGGDKAPDWASFMSGEEYRAFEGEMLAEFRRRGYEPRLTGDGGIDAAGGRNPGVYGLFNIAQVCHANDRGVWPRIIRDHVGMLDSAAALAGEPMEIETARPLLRVRLFRVADTQPNLLDSIVKRELAPDLLGALAIDLPTTVRTCSDDDVEHWGISVDEAFGIAIANLADEVRGYVREELDLGDGQTGHMFLGDTFFVPSQIVRFAEIVDDAGNGALVVLPNRHQLAWHVISSGAGTVAAITSMTDIAATGYREGPGSLTPDLYWWHEGDLTLLARVWPDRKAVQFDPPAEFGELLDSLP